MTLSVQITFEADYENDRELETERWYWNYNDGELFMFLDISEDEVTVVHMDGSVEIHQREGMVYNEEEIGITIRPVQVDRVWTSGP